MKRVQLPLGLILLLSAAVIEEQVSAQGHVFTTQDLDKPARQSLSRLDSMKEPLAGGLGFGLPPNYPSIIVKGGFGDDDDYDDDFYDQQFYGYKRLMLDGYDQAALNKLDRLLLESTTDQVSEKTLELYLDRAILLHRLGNELAALAAAKRAQGLAKILGGQQERISSLVESISKQLELNQE